MTSRALQLISTAIAKLRSLSQVDIQHHWQCCDREQDWSSPVAELNQKGHIAWSEGKQVLWLGQKLVIPDNLHSFSLQGFSLRLALTWWADFAQIFVNGQLVQEGDLFDCSTRVLLSQNVIPGEVITVTLRLVSPSHDPGALVRSLLIYESSNDDCPEPGFIADELAVLHQYLYFDPEKLAAAVAEIDWQAIPHREKFERSLLQLRSSLLEVSHEIKQRRIYLLGHAHLDLAWLWSISETWEVAQSTFESVLKLLQEFPDLIFCHSTPALYAWIEQHRPDLFAAIKQQIELGRWEVVGGLWVESELNLIAGESIVRQLLYGQRYVLEKFGSISQVAWLPDTFGFCATLPQIFKQAGIEYFVTQKLRWNDTTEFPYGAFWWRSPDGTELFSFMSAPIGEGIDPIKMASYADNWERQTNLPQSLWLPGVGDHGGGPTRDMLELAARWQKSPFFPHLEFTTVQKYLAQIRSQETGLPTFPVWEDELYLEFHRGCYTTHADQKLWNRQCEGLLYQAELFATLASLTAGLAYPKLELETAWKQVLFNQFHDILPGSSIREVYLDANQAWQEAKQASSSILQQSINAIASQITLPLPPDAEAQPIVVFNPLNWQRSEVVAVSLPSCPSDWVISTLEAQPLTCQISSDSRLLFLATDIPAVGYRVFWLHRRVKDKEITDLTERIPPSDSYSEQKYFEPKDWILENEFLTVVIDQNSGNLSSVFDKVNHREILNQDGGNQLQAFADSGQYWDAWNIDPNYAQHPLPVTKLKSIAWLEQGSIQTSIRVVLQLGNSEFCQDYILQQSSPLLKITTTVDWQERQVLVKTAFGLNLEAHYATYEIPCGAIARPTQPTTPAEKAKWEVPALRWADISTSDYGVSLLNDCKYGYDSQPNQLRLTLLRSASWPNLDADKGKHEFTYALYPHAGTWQQAHTVRRGYELNLPLQVVLLPSVASFNAGNLPSMGRFLDLSAENLILMALKQSEADPQQLIVRCYECHGQPAALALESQLELNVVHHVDLLERPTDSPQLESTSTKLKISPWEIATFTVRSTTDSPQA